MREIFRNELYDWLEGQFTEAETPTETTPGTSELVVKDPRLSWFLGLWRSAALRCEATPAYVTMLRPVTEVVGSKERYYSTRFGEIDRTAAWVNMMLHTERATRGSQRAFVPRHVHLLLEIAVCGHARELDEPAQCDLAPLAAYLGLAERLHELVNLALTAYEAAPRGG